MSGKVTSVIEILLLFYKTISEFVMQHMASFINYAIMPNLIQFILYQDLEIPPQTSQLSLATKPRKRTSVLEEEVG